MRLPWPRRIDISQQPEYPLVTDPQVIATIAREIAEHGWMAFDIEFVSEDRFIPELSLVQVAWGDTAAPNVALIDCLASLPVPLFELIGRADIEIIAHSARQDLGLLAVRYGVRAQALWDTQIAAAFIGLGEQLGYAKLVEELLAVRLDKGAQYTAWLERPLSPRQLRYAAADVQHLPAVWAKLEARLRACGRLSWVREESERLAASATPLGPPEAAYRDVKGWRGLDDQALGSLRALAAWRQEQALLENKPLSWILPDHAMIELCRTGAASARAVRAVRGVGEGIARRYGDAIVAAIAAGALQPLPAPSPKPPLSACAQVWSSMLLALVQSRCQEAGIAPRFVATRDDTDELAAWFERSPEQVSEACDPPGSGGNGRSDGPLDLDLLRGWRRVLAGDMALAWLRGECALAIAPTGVQITGYATGRNTSDRA